MAHYDATDEVEYGQLIDRRGFLKLLGVAGVAAAGDVASGSTSPSVGFGYGGVRMTDSWAPTGTDAPEEDDVDGRSAPPHAPVPDDDASQGYGEFWYGG